MSTWDEHIHGLLATKCVQHAAIIDLNGGICANSANFNLSIHPVELSDEKSAKHTAQVDEIQILLKLVNNKGLVDTPPGIWINNMRYYLVRWDDDLNAASLKTNNGGATVMKTNKCIIVGTWASDVNQGQGNCNQQIFKLGESFLSVGY